MVSDVIATQLVRHKSEHIDNAIGRQNMMMVAVLFLPLLFFFSCLVGCLRIAMLVSCFCFHCNGYDTHSFCYSNRSNIFASHNPSCIHEQLHLVESLKLDYDQLVALEYCFRQFVFVQVNHRP